MLQYFHFISVLVDAIQTATLFFYELLCNVTQNVINLEMWGRAQREATRRCASDWGHN